LKYWLASYRKDGFEGLENKSTRPHSHPNETAIRVKERILELRTRSHECALKINLAFENEGVRLCTRTIGNILKRQDLTRKYRIRRVKYKYVKIPLKPGEMVEIDIKYVPSTIEGKQYYQFTAIECSSRWRYLKIYDDMSSYSAIEFLKEVLVVAPFKILNIKTDNGSCFTNRYVGYLKSSDPQNPKLHALDQFCISLNIQHYLIAPGKPAQNGKVERSHRSDQETFYDEVLFSSLEDLRYKLKLWNMFYNDLPHCSLNLLSPNQVLGRGVQYVLA
jgi:hypothetical protein